MSFFDYPGMTAPPVGELGPDYAEDVDADIETLAKALPVTVLEGTGGATDESNRCEDAFGAADDAGGAEVALKGIFRWDRQLDNPKGRLVGSGPFSAKIIAGAEVEGGLLRIANPRSAVRELTVDGNDLAEAPIQLYDSQGSELYRVETTGGVGPGLLIDQEGDTSKNNNLTKLMHHVSYANGEEGYRQVQGSNGNDLLYFECTASNNGADGLLTNGHAPKIFGGKYINNGGRPVRLGSETDNAVVGAVLNNPYVEGNVLPNILEDTSTGTLIFKNDNTGEPHPRTNQTGHNALTWMGIDLNGFFICRPTAVDDGIKYYVIIEPSTGQLTIKPGGAVNDVDMVVAATGLGTAKLGDSTIRKIGFFGAEGAVRAANIPSPSGGAVIDTEARIAINAILALFRNSTGYGLTAG